MADQINKQGVLKIITAAAASGQITFDETVAAFKAGNPKAAKATTIKSTNPKKHNISAPDVMYHVGALVMYGSMLAFLGASWDEMGAVMQLFSTLFIGLALWAIAFILIRNASDDDDQKDGVGNALLLTGTLAVSLGVGVMTQLIFGEDTGDAEVATLFAVFVVGTLNFGMDRLLKRFFNAIFASLAAIAFYGVLVVLLFGEVLEDPPELSALFAIVGAIMLMSIGSLYRKHEPQRTAVAGFNTSLGGFAVMAVLFSLVIGGDFYWLWQALFPMLVIAALVLSMKAGRNSFVYTGGFFAWAYVTYMSFRYFGEGAGLAGALLLSGLSLVAIGVLLTSVRKKYFTAQH